MTATASATTGNDPIGIIDSRNLSRLQIAAIALTIGLNALDGFDVLSISFASPGIAKEWGIDRAALGLVLSMELIGMAVGSILLGGAADRFGRRPTILTCLVVMATGMFMATTAHDVVTLSVWRVVTGLGIGGMLAAINAAAAEFTNARHRGLVLALMVIGYPLGAVIGGSIAAMLLDGGDWRAVFEFGAMVTAAFIPLVWFFMPETVAWEADRQRPGALERINRTLVRMRHPAVGALPPLRPSVGKVSIAELLGPMLRASTILLTIAYLAHITSFYFILKWVPKIVVDMGFASSSATRVLVWANVGGVIGGGLFGLLASRVGLQRLSLIMLAGSAVMLAVFGRGQADLAQLAMICAVCGFFTNAAVVGLYSITARAFPTHVRASGTGFVIGVGRGGSALAPAAAGAMFQAGAGLQIVALTMACGSLIALAAIARIKLTD